MMTTMTQWPKPLDLLSQTALRPVEQFDPDLLPDALRDWICDESDRMGCPLDFVAIPAMVALAACVGRRLSIRPKQNDNWRVYPLLWGAVVAPPGAMKSPAMNRALRPLQPIEARWSEEHDYHLTNYEADRAVFEASKKAVSQQMEKAARDGDKQAMEKARTGYPVEPEKPVRRRLVVNSATVEAYLQALTGNPNGCLLHSDELIGWLRTMDRPGREGERQFWLQCWTGDGRYHETRIGRGDTSVEALAACVLGSVQPGPLREYLTDRATRGAGADGLIERFQMTVWPDPVEAQWVDRIPDDAAYQRAAMVFEKAAGENAEGIQSGTVLSFDTDALGTFKQWYLDHEKRLKGLHGAFCSHLAKYRSLVPSLALLLHVADGTGAIVTADCVEKAIRWARYLESHARRIYDVAPDAATLTMQTLAQHIADGDLSGTFTARDVYRHGWEHLKTSEQVERVLERLVAASWVRPTDNERRSGRPSETFEINPAVLK